MKCDVNNETGVLQKRKISILDLYIDEIKNLLDMGLSIAKIYNKINKNLPGEGISYNGFYRFCKRRGLR